MSTAPTHSTTFATSIIFDRETRDYALFLDGDLVGFARTEAEAEITLDQLVYELLSGGYTILTANPFPPADPPHLADALPLPPIATIAEALDVLAAHDDDPVIYTEAAQHLAAGITISAAGADHLIDGVRVRRAPPAECWPWPWRCACGDTRCWHGALLEGILYGWERLGDDPHPLPFEAAA